MSAMKSLAGIVTGTLFALLGLFLVLCTARVQQSCAGFEAVMAHPIDALTFVPASVPEPSDDYAETYVWPFQYGDNNSPGCIPVSSVLASELETLLAAGGLLVAAGWIAYRRGSRRSGIPSAFTAFIAAGLCIVPAYAARSDASPEIAAIGIVVALLFSAPLGYAGAMLARRFESAWVPASGPDIDSRPRPPDRKSPVSEPTPAAGTSRLKAVASIATGTFFALIVLTVFHGGGVAPECSIFKQLFFHPIDALTGTPSTEFQGPTEIPYLFGPTENWQCGPVVTPSESWLGEWLPLCCILVAAGAITFRRSDRRSILGSAIASSLAAGVVFGLPLLFADAKDSMPAQQSIAILVWAIIIGGLLGYAGGAASKGLEFRYTR